MSVVVVSGGDCGMVEVRVVVIARRRMRRILGATFILLSLSWSGWMMMMITTEIMVKGVTSWQLQYHILPSRSTTVRRFHRRDHTTTAGISNSILGSRSSTGTNNVPTIRSGHGRWMMIEQNDDNDMMITTTTISALGVNEINENYSIHDNDHEPQDTLSSLSSSSSTMIPAIPANLRRKIQAKRPTLGHVVPYKYKQAQQSAAHSSTTSMTSGGSVPSQLRLQGRREKLELNNNNNNYLIKIMAGMARGRKLESPSTVYLRPMMGKVKEAIYSTLTSFGIYNSDTTSSSSPSRNRPTSSKIRHLDIFAGSGSVGLESLSRGATHCTFVDFSMDCCTCIQRNIDLTRLGTVSATTSGRSLKSTHPSNNGDDDDTTRTNKSTLVCCADAMTALTDPYSVGVLSSSPTTQGSTTTTTTPYQIITICPPYEEVIYGDLLEAVVGSDTVTEDTIVIIEYPIELIQSPKQKSSSPINNKQESTNYGMPHVIQSKSNTAIGIRNRKYGRTVIAFYIINPTGRYPDANSRPEEFVKPV